MIERRLALSASSALVALVVAGSFAAAPAHAQAARDEAAKPRATERRPAQSRVEQEAASGALRVTRTIDAERWQPGSPITMTVSVSAPDARSVRIPPIGATYGPFDAKDPAAATPQSPSLRTVILFAWEAGPAEVPAMDVSATLADGSTVTAALPAVAIELESLLGDGIPLTDLASEIRGPVEIDTGSWLWWVAAGTAGAAALAFAWWLRSRGAAAAAEPPLPPAEWAMRELDRLDADGLPARGEVDSFFVRLSGIVRTYIEGRFAIAAPDRTTQEFLREASRNATLAGENERELGAFLRTADMVKFAAARPADEACAQAMRSMRAFVERTAPRPEAPDAEAAGPRDAAGDEPPVHLPEARG